MSDHSVNIVKVGEAQKHPNADRLEILEIYGYQVISKKGTFKKGDLAVFVEPDYVVPFKEPFKFLFESKSQPGTFKEEPSRGRVRTIKLRGERSYGLLLPVTDCPELQVKDMKPGTNVMEILGIKRWEPPAPDDMPGQGTKAGDPVKGPKGVEVPHYDIENLQRYPNVMKQGEDCVATEKLHGSQFKLVYQNGVLFIGSRNQWKIRARDPKMLLGWVANKWRQWFPGEEKRSIGAWAKILKIPDFHIVWDFLRKHPRYALYGEVVGPSVQKGYAYGVPDGEVRIRFFEIYDMHEPRWPKTGVDGEMYEPLEGFGKFMDWWKIKNYLSEDVDCYQLFRKFWVPVIYAGPYDQKMLLAACEGNSTIKEDLVREGIVVRPVHERFEPRFGRAILKVVNPAYLERE